MRPVLVLLLVLSAAPAYAESERYAVVIGANHGAPDEQALQFAESDAARISELLGEVGGVADENQVVLRGKDADAVRRALIATNERIRIGQRAGSDAVLVVYYSGHGDADALHLGGSRLALRELEALVRGSSARVRILVIDACRSGAVTRVKGGTPAAPLALPAALDEPPGEGLIILTASTASEDAQESDVLAGSFFTHYLLSALRGAADDDGDQLVTVEEAFRYAREQTILASSRTFSGTQHPTFHYDLRGRAEIVLADLGSARGRGQLTLPDGATWLVMRNPGGVVGEIVAGAKRRTLSLVPGTYRVRGRASDALLEGTVEVAVGRDTTVDPHALDRTTYARLVRKGHGEIVESITGLALGALAMSPAIAGASPCVGLYVGGDFVRTDVTLSPRFTACHGGFTNPTLHGMTDGFAVELRASHPWDLGAVTLDLGIAGGAELLQERFETLGLAPTRTSLAGHVDASAGATLPLHGRLDLHAELAGQTHFLPIESQAGVRSWTARFGVRMLTGIGLYF